MIIKHRIRAWYFSYYWRKKIPYYTHQKERAVFSWHFVPIDLCMHADHAACIAKAQTILSGNYAVLGSQEQAYTAMPWHTDIRLAQVSDISPHFPHEHFFADIHITSGTDALNKDIKVPWELARCHMMPLLGHVYMITHDEQYAQKCVALILDWIYHNPFLYGIHWMNPMESGIRIINWIIALSMIQNSMHVSASVRQKIGASVHEHLLFIEGNFEYYDGKTSNHYLSDLVGYMYGSYFLGYEQNVTWALQELETEIRKQILPDGFSYEGSTRYHQLVIELLYYAQCLCDHAQITVSDCYKGTMRRMRKALWWSCPYNGDPIMIGDDDSGKVVSFPFDNHAIVGDCQEQYFKDFGLSVYKTHKIHCTLRHHTYHNAQPSGHFHNDVGSMTLAINGLPIIVDPGSYLYTASCTWRNYFRSAVSHNGIFIKNHEPVPLTNTLFVLALQEQKHTDKLFSAQQEQYAQYGVSMNRTITCSDTVITVRDIIKSSTHDTYTLCWQFIIHPSITPLCDNGKVLLCKDDLVRAIIQSEQLQLSIESAYYAPAYGVIQETKCVRAYMPSASMEVMITITC